METKPHEHPDGSAHSSDVLDDRDERPWEHVHERPISPEQWER